MKIEKKYYDTMLLDSEKIENEINLELANLSEIERKELEEQHTLEAQRIINLVHEKIQHTWHIRNKEKSKTFNALYKRALHFAKENSMNILIETDTTSGRIKLSTPFIHYGDFAPSSNKDTLIALIADADSFMIQHENNMISLDFDYNLTTAIVK